MVFRRTFVEWRRDLLDSGTDSTSYFLGLLKINKCNCIEILEFAEHICNDTLKQSALDYIVDPKNFEIIMGRNLDIIDMSPSLLLEILGNDATSIQSDSSLNEERLFQIGWTYIHTKTDEEFATFLPKLLKAVHLPLVSGEFLSNLTRKVHGCEDAMELIERAKFQKIAIASFIDTSEKPEIDENT